MSGPTLPDPQPLLIRAFHGATEGPIVGPFAKGEMYVGPRRIADAYADPGEPVYEVRYQARAALILATAEQVGAAWELSGALTVQTDFHRRDGQPGQGGLLCAFARGLGYDAVHVPASAFYEDEVGDTLRDIEWTDEIQELWETVAGTWGDPQSILLDPARAEISQIGVR